MILETNYRTVEPGITVLEMKGKVAAGNLLRSLEDELKGKLQGGVKRLVLDISGVSYMDSSGIGFLMAISGEGETSGGKVAVAGAQGRIRELLKMTHVDKVLSLHDDADAAVKSLQQP